MQDDYFALMQKLAPDLAQEIERRALVLERIGALQPVGRRALAARLNMPEREVLVEHTVKKPDFKVGDRVRYATYGNILVAYEVFERAPEATPSTEQ